MTISLPLGTFFPGTPTVSFHTRLLMIFPIRTAMEMLHFRDGYVGVAHFSLVMGRMVDNQMEDQRQSHTSSSAFPSSHLWDNVLHSPLPRHCYHICLPLEHISVPRIHEPWLKYSQEGNWVLTYERVRVFNHCSQLNHLLIMQLSGNGMGKAGRQEEPSCVESGWRLSGDQNSGLGSRTQAKQQSD